jgi:hypothetical protein
MSLMLMGKVPLLMVSSYDDVDGLGLKTLFLAF